VRDITELLGFRSEGRKNSVRVADDGRDVAKLFFDSFSKRVTNSEDAMRSLVAEVERVKSSVEQSRISDLVLLERVEKVEQLIRDSLSVIKQSLDETLRLIRESPIEPVRQGQGAAAQSSEEKFVEPRLVVASHILSPTGELGSLKSITTPTELQVLNLLASEGPKTAPEIGVSVGRSREHSARLMKRLYEEGYVRRDQTRTPFRYSIVEKIILANKTEVKDGEKEEISVPRA
jgi:predicted transcriptional regulator